MELLRSERAVPRLCERRSQACVIPGAEWRHEADDPPSRELNVRVQQILTGFTAILDNLQGLEVVAKHTVPRLQSQGRAEQHQASVNVHGNALHVPAALQMLRPQPLPRHGRPGEHRGHLHRAGSPRRQDAGYREGVVQHQALLPGCQGLVNIIASTSTSQRGRL
eukprot:scaffold837_cov255-Pinguiococcus_pyrenoidosus.AAC.6